MSGSEKLVYRLHGPTQISTTYEIGNATLSPGANAPSISGHLEFEITSSGNQGFRRKAEGIYLEKARSIVSILAFVFGEGLILGNYYKSWPQTNATFHTRSEYLEIAENIYDNINTNVEKNDSIRRGLNWYNFALSTRTSEDQLVAAWTGLEALTSFKKKKYSYSSYQRRVIERAKDNVLYAIPITEPDKRSLVSGYFGSMLKGEAPDNNEERVIQTLENNVDENHLPIKNNISKDVKEIYCMRNKIVHEGRDISNAEPRGNDAQKFLRELLIAKVPDMFYDLIPQITPPRYEKLIFETHEWLPIVFEYDYTKILTRKMLKRRMVALVRNLRLGYEDVPLSSITQRSAR